MRTAERIAMRVADVTASGKGERTRGWTSSEARVVHSADVRWRKGNFRQLLIQGTHWSKPKDIAVSIGCFSDAERLTRNDVRTAVTHVVAQIGDLTAVAECGSKGQAAAPVGGVGNLPATNHEVGEAVDVAHIFLAAPDRKFVYRADDENMVAAEIIGTVGETRIHRVVII